MSTSPTTCQAIDEDLSALIDEELAAARAAEVRAHLVGCQRCAHRLQELCNVDLALASLRAPRVASDLHLRLASRLADDAPAPARPVGGRDRGAAPPRARRRLARHAGGLAALAAGVALALYVTLRSGEPPAPDVSRVAEASRPVAPGEAAGPGRTASDEALLAAPAPEQTEPARVASAERAPASAAELESLPDEDLALLFVLDDVEDLDVIANLDLLERFVDAEASGEAG